MIGGGWSGATDVAQAFGRTGVNDARHPGTGESSASSTPTRCAACGGTRTPIRKPCGNSSCASSACCALPHACCGLPRALAIVEARADDIRATRHIEPLPTIGRTICAAARWQTLVDGADLSWCGTRPVGHQASHSTSIARLAKSISRISFACARARKRVCRTFDRIARSASFARPRAPGLGPDPASDRHPSGRNNSSGLWRQRTARRKADDTGPTSYAAIHRPSNT